MPDSEEKLIWFLHTEGRTWLMVKNNPLSEKEADVFELLNGLIENAEDKKLAFTVMLCCINNDELCDKVLSIPDGRRHITVSDINSCLSEFIEPLEIVDDEEE